MNKLYERLGELIALGILFRILISVFSPILFIVFIGIALAFLGSIFKSAQNVTRKKEYRREKKYSIQEYVQLNDYLTRWFQHETTFWVGNGYHLQLKNREYRGLDSLDVYDENGFVEHFQSFKKSRPEKYAYILQELMTKAKNGSKDENIIDVQVTKHEEKRNHFVEEIDDLNASIQDNEVKEALYKTRALLLQIDELEKTFPESKDKLRKLYEYYLPYLTNILEKFAKVQIFKIDDDYDGSKSKLIKTVFLVNEAMENIISNMNDEDFMELNADMSTLEAILKKDGLTNDGRMEPWKHEE
ncbi:MULTISPECIES: hypothetical protein [Terrabacteria group]|uniref:hypothetical protein n=1 Tax=Bacillati TaxID=1783272 RepID=UPI001C6E3171|nr:MULTISPECIES: hypothetical protein [Terrabacteria group]MBW9212551.1 hypothetical protein [Trueperella sp. zg.1013]